MAIDRETGNRRGEGTVLFNISLALGKLSDHAQAIAYAQAALEIQLQVEDPRADKAGAQLAEWCEHPEVE